MNSSDVVTGIESLAESGNFETTMLVKLLWLCDYFMTPTIQISLIMKYALGSITHENAFILLNEALKKMRKNSQKSKLELKRFGLATAHGKSECFHSLLYA